MRPETTDNDAKFGLKSNPVVSRTPRAACRAVHAVAIAALTLGLGGIARHVWLPVRTASGQTAQTAEVLAASLTARSEDGDSKSLPLVSESLLVDMDGGHVTATYGHVFQNETTDRLEGNYRLAVGEGATATGFSYWNGETRIVGEIFEREAARGIYEALTGLRRDPGLLEQSGEGGFSFRVFPIEPGEKKRVEVTTSRWLSRRGGPFEYRARLSRTDATVVLRVHDDRGIASLESPTHELSIVKTSDTAWSATVRHAPGSSDELVVRYRPTGGSLGMHATVHHDAGQDAFFTASLATPALDAKNARPASDVTLVLDRSGSMEGESIESARNAAKAILGRLRSDDRVNVIAFDDGVETLYSEPHDATDATRREAERYVARIQASGGTNIAGALSRSLAAQAKNDRPHVVLFLTDGQSDGPSTVQAATDDKSDTRVFTVGIGTGVDKALLSKLAKLRRGRFTFIADPRAVETEFPKVLSQLEEPALTDLRLRAEGGEIERIYPDAIGELFPADELRVFGRIRGKGPVTLIVEGKDHGVARRFEQRVDPTAVASEPWVGRGWARARVDDLLEQTRVKGETDELKNEAIELGLAYALVTPYTSFLAIPENELTQDAKDAVGSMRDRRKQILAAHKDAAALSRLNMPPGDPILKVRAPRDARRVTALFPFGVAQDLAYDTFSETWMTRFLVPKDVADGTYEVPVLIVHANGEVTAASASYTIDSRVANADIDVRPVDGGVDIRVLVDEPVSEVRASVVGRYEESITLSQSAIAGGLVGYLALPPGRYELRIVIADRARNETERLVEVEVL